MMSSPSLSNGDTAADTPVKDAAAATQNSGATAANNANNNDVEKATPATFDATDKSESNVDEEKIDSRMSGGDDNEVGKERGGNRHRKRNILILLTLLSIMVSVVGLAIGLSNNNSNNNNVNGGISDEDLLSDSEDDAIILGISTTNQTSYKPSSNKPTQYPSTKPSLMQSSSPSLNPTSSTSPSSHPSQSPTIHPSNEPSTFPSILPSLSKQPSANPSDSPSFSTLPTYSPTNQPSTSIKPSINPTTSTQPTYAFQPGDLSIINEELSIRLSAGLSVRKIAQTGEYPLLKNGILANQTFHAKMDGAGVIELEDGAYVYVSNSEMARNGGVYALYFDKDGNITDYKTLLYGTKRNCGGGLTPWNTWISCEEVAKVGQCWQIDPNPNNLFHTSPNATLLGGSGGRFETVTVDNSSHERPIFYLTEDHGSGALRRFEANGTGWDALHEGGEHTYLNILNETSYEWTENLTIAQNSARIHYQNAEGAVYHDGLLYFAAKKTQLLFILNLEDGTYTKESTGSQFAGQGSFNAQPDQIILTNYKRWIYFSEDGGFTPGVYIREKSGTYKTIFEAINGTIYTGDETVGIALGPDRRQLYAGFQDAGILMEFSRDDGHPFE